MLNKYRRFIVILLLTSAFILRFTAAVQMPIGQDEQYKYQLAQKIPLNLGNSHFRWGDEKVPHSLLSVYLTKLSILWFGPTLLAGRIIFVIFGTLSLYFLYRLVHNELGVKIGVFGLFLLSFSQFHIGESAQIREEAPLLLIVSIVIYLLFRYVRSGQKRYFYLMAVMLGIGYLFKEIILGLLLAIIIFVILNPNYRKNLRLWDGGWGIILMSLPIIPYVHWQINHNFINYTNENYSVGISLRAFYMYAGEIIAWLEEISRYFSFNLQEEALYFINPKGEQTFISGLSPEFPVAHWVTGSLIIFSLVATLRSHAQKIKPLIKFCLILFFTVFFITTFIDNALFDSHWRASMTIIPGIIFIADTIMTKMKQNILYPHVTVLLIVYFIAHAVYFVINPTPLFGFTI